MAQIQPIISIIPNTRTTNDDGYERFSEAHLERLGRQRPAIFSSWLAEVGFVCTVVMSMMMSEFFISGFNIILPSVSTSLQLKGSAQTWPAAATNLATAAFLMPFARLCNMYGGRIIFIGGQVWLLIWSIVCGFSRSPTMLITCRALQGVGSSAFMPAGLALLGSTYRPGPRKNLIFGIYGALASIGFYFGILVGAVATEFLSWRWYFWLGGIIAGAVALGGILAIPRNLDDKDSEARMDWLGAAIIVPGLALVVYAFTDSSYAPNEWATPYIWVTLTLGVLLLLGAIYVQGWISTQPLLPASLLRPRYMKRLAGSLFCAYGVFGLYLYYASF